MANGEVEADFEVGDAELGITKGGNGVVVSGGGLPRAEDAKARLSAGELEIARWSVGELEIARARLGELESDARERFGEVDGRLLRLVGELKVDALSAAGREVRCIGADIDAEVGADGEARALCAAASVRVADARVPGCVWPRLRLRLCSGWESVGPVSTVIKVMGRG
jgi:hypothetical protein